MTDPNQGMSNESNGLWLPIIEYSVRTGISLSTIRRKIKSQSIPFRLDRGKYWLLLDSVSAGGEELPASGLGATSRDGVKGTLETSVKAVSDAFEYALKEKDDRIRTLEKKNRELEDRLDEMRLLVQVLEERFAVRY